ncbi:MAG: beta-lactamase family protein [Bacteroidales bacterium]|jgi:CubicO group peptidase (beta-lactamase class C family)|nr:beta-lactamase family protein [Bacteroidales bacterium]
MKNVFFAVFLCLISCGIPRQSKDLLRSELPEQQGVSSGGLLRYLTECEKSGDEMHRVMLLRHGKVVLDAVWKPFEPNDKQTIYSCSKTFTATAIGLLQDKGLLSVEDKVISFFPNELPDSVSPNLASMRIKDLLTMSCGLGEEPHGIRSSDKWVRNFLAYPVDNKPGTVFKYNSMATFMLSAIVQKVTGQRLLDFLQQELFSVLGIKDVDWEISPEGINTGGWGLRAHIEDMAKLGQLYLQKGKWNGKQILSEKWVNEATGAQIMQNPSATEQERLQSDWLQGYGYQIWRCRHNSFRGDGAYGQFIIVLPDKDAVIAVQASVSDMQAEINRIWNYLLPAIKREKELAKDDITYAFLCSILNSLAITPPASTAKGQSDISVNFGDTLNLTVSTGGDTCYVKWRNDDFVFGREKWIVGFTTRPVWNLLPNKSAFSEFPPFKVACSYAWDSGTTSKDTASLALYIKYLESPHTEKIVLSF